MKKIQIIIVSFILFNQFSSGQIKNNVYKLNSVDENFLTEDVEEIINKNIIDKKVVFLGESEHHIGSDFKAKFELVKFLVEHHNYKKIVFESDFFGLYFEHDKKNVFYHWSNSLQCKELFSFLKENDVVLLGMDNQLHSLYAYYNFTEDLSEFLLEANIDIDKRFIDLVDLVPKNRFKLNKKISKEDKDYLIESIDSILLKVHSNIKENELWPQILRSFKSSVIMYYSNNTKSGIALRDSQMAKNLDFLTNSSIKDKFIVWLANAHMSKRNDNFMKGQTMGYQYTQLNPDISYHIAVSSIKMPYRKHSWLNKAREKDDNLLSLLPNITNNYFIDSKKIIADNPEYANKEYEGMFNLNKDKTNWFSHFDALVFIAKGEKNKMMEKK